MQLHPLFALGLWLAINAVVFVAFGWDKLAAKRGATRTRERTLLLLGVPLAAPGMWLGMRTFRHKTCKVSFLAWAWLVTAVNLALAWGLFAAWDRGWIGIAPLGQG